MPEHVSSRSGKIPAAIITLLAFTVVQKIDGFVLNPPESTNHSRTSRSNDEDKDGPVPSCANSTFCLETPYYPTDLVDVLVRENDVKYLATVDKPLEPFRMDYSIDGEALCNSQEMIVTPKTALSADGMWLYVVNYNDYVQAVRVEICTFQNRPCKFVEGFSDGWRSVCKQSYVYRQMVAVTPDGRISPQLFKLPASCKCYVKFMGDPFKSLAAKIAMSKRIQNSPEEPIQ